MSVYSRCHFQVIQVSITNNGRRMVSTNGRAVYLEHKFLTAKNDLRHACSYHVRSS